MHRLYVDGCSMVYGDHLDRQYSLANLIHATSDFSECGKSNIAIAEDFYKNINNFDTFVIGFTFSARYTFEMHNKRQHLIPGRYISQFGEHTGAADDEENFAMLNKWFYYFSELDTMSLRSDFYIDSIITLLEKYKKKFVVFSWEKRNTASQRILYPKFYKMHKLADGHLNELGMVELSKFVMKHLNEK